MSQSRNELLHHWRSGCTMQCMYDFIINIKPDDSILFCRRNCWSCSVDWYTVWVKKIPPEVIWIFSLFHKRLSIFNRFFTHLLYVPMYARLQIFIQLSPTLTKLCHMKCDYLVHLICAKCPKRAKKRTFRRLRKSLLALLIVVCGKSL